MLWLGLFVKWEKGERWRWRGEGGEEWKKSSRDSRQRTRPWEKIYYVFRVNQKIKHPPLAIQFQHHVHEFLEHEEWNRKPSVENRENTRSEYAINYCYLMRKPLVCKHKCHIHLKSLLCQLTGAFRCGKTTETTACNPKHAFTPSRWSQRDQIWKKEAVFSEWNGIPQCVLQMFAQTFIRLSFAIRKEFICFS